MEVVLGKAPSRRTSGNAGDNKVVAALRSKPEGMAAEQRLTMTVNLMHSRLGRCRETPRGTADDAILTLKILFSLNQLMNWRLGLGRERLPAAISQETKERAELACT